MSKVYSGVGSRKSPPEILTLMTSIALYLNTKGYWLRTGGADGADLAFAKGGQEHTLLYLPWANYNKQQVLKVMGSVKGSPRCHSSVGASPEAIAIAKRLHPAPDKCSDSVWKMHGRNCHIVSGLSLDHPSEFVLLWTPEGKKTGGTAMAWEYAQQLNIPVLNLYNIAKTSSTNWVEMTIDWINNVQSNSKQN